MGSQLVSQDDMKLLKGLGVGGVLSLQDDNDLRNLGMSFESLRHMSSAMGIDLRRVPVRDHEPAALISALPAAVSELVDLMNSYQRVYVHCTAGINRSAGVVLTYLVVKRGMGVVEAMALIRARRPFVSPYSSLVSALEQGTLRELR